MPLCNLRTLIVTGSNHGEQVIINVTDDSPYHVSIRTILGPRGWEIKFDTELGRKRDYPRLRELLHRLEIPFEENQGGEGYYHPKRFDYDENLDHVGTVLQELVDKLATSKG